MRDDSAIQGALTCQLGVLAPEGVQHLVCRLHIYQSMLERRPGLLEHLAVVPSDVPLVNVQALFRHVVFPLESGTIDDGTQSLEERRPVYLKPWLVCRQQ